MEWRKKAGYLSDALTVATIIGLGALVSGCKDSKPVDKGAESFNKLSGEAIVACFKQEDPPADYTVVENGIVYDVSVVTRENMHALARDKSPNNRNCALGAAMEAFRVACKSNSNPDTEQLNQLLAETGIELKATCAEAGIARLNKTPDDQ